MQGEGPHLCRVEHCDKREIGTLICVEWVIKQGTIQQF